MIFITNGSKSGKKTKSKWWNFDFRFGSKIISSWKLIPTKKNWIRFSQMDQKIFQRKKVKMIHMWFGSGSKNDCILQNHFHTKINFKNVIFRIWSNRYFRNGSKRLIFQFFQKWIRKMIFQHFSRLDQKLIRKKRIPNDSKMNFKK